MIGISEAESDEAAMICSSDISAFFALATTVSVEKGGVRIPRDVMQALDIKLGDEIRYLVL